MPRLRILALAAALAAAPAAAAAQSPEAKAAYEEGVRFKQAKKHTAALGAFLRAAQLDPRYAAAWTDAGNAQLALGKTPDAAKSFERALALEPADLTARYNLAYALRQLGQYDRAAQQYQVYLEKKPDDADAHYGLAETLKAAGKPLAAAEAFEAYARTEKRPTWKKYIGQARKEAAALREKAKTAPPTAPQVSTAPAVAAAKPAVTGGAAKPAPAPEAKKAKTTKKDLHLSFSQGIDDPPEPDEVPVVDSAPSPVETLEPAASIAASGQRPEAFTAGLEQLKKGDFAAALTRLKIALAESPDDPMVLAATASAHLGLLDGPAAEHEYRKALKVADTKALPALYLGLGESLRIQGYDDEASEVYRLGAEHEASTPAVAQICKQRLASTDS